MAVRGWLGPVDLLVLVVMAEGSLSLQDGGKAYRLSVSINDGSVLCAQVNSASYPQRQCTVRGQSYQPDNFARRPAG